MFRKTILFGGLATAVAVVIVGCSKSPTPSEKTADSKVAAVKPNEEHGHKPGAHGGILVSLGKDSYHAEAVFVKNGAIREGWGCLPPVSRNLSTVVNRSTG